ncbi:hypothetical protein MX659_05485 [Coriobacteriia bacterium Es71-Z0120]|uniref:hypothetical protein n=1 Tax=Parvivirga hydrogeniphila TaxID=2939460 RepID=UPI002260F7CF|nr:hypothetical protein [Parvivirga hydrogeniphila]MCL4079037.1 hypothetical protein [Parvivirga hydrogeniphila]
MPQRIVRLLLTACMDLLVLVAVAATAGMVVRFFGSLASSALGESVLPILAAVRLPLGLGGIKTPYGGIFDLDAAATVAAALFVEWALAGVRRRS